MLLSRNAMLQVIIGAQLNVKKIQLGYVHTKMMQLVHPLHTNTYFWQLIQSLKAKMTVKSMRRQEDSKELLNKSELITSKR